MSQSQSKSDAFDKENKTLYSNQDGKLNYEKAVQSIGKVQSQARHVERKRRLIMNEITSLKSIIAHLHKENQNLDDFLSNEYKEEYNKCKEATTKSEFQSQVENIHQLNENIKLIYEENIIQAVKDSYILKQKRLTSHKIFGENTRNYQATIDEYLLIDEELHIVEAEETAKLKILQSELAQSENKLCDAVSQNELSKKRLEELMATKDSLKKQVQDTSASIERLQSDIETLGHSIGLQNDKIGDLKSKIKTIQANDYTSKLVELDNQLSDTHFAANQIINYCDSINIFNDELFDATDNLIETIDGQLNSLVEKAVGIQREIHDCHKRTLHVIDEKENTRDRLQRRKDDKAHLKNELDACIASLKTKYAQNEECFVPVEKFCEDMLAFELAKKKDTDDIVQHNQQLQAQIDEANLNLKTQSEEIVELEHQKSSLLENANNKKWRVTEFKKNITFKSDELGKVKKTNEALLKKIHSLTEKNEQLLQAKLFSSQEINQLSQLLSQKKNDDVVLHDSISKKQEKLAVLQAQTDEKLREYENFSNQTVIITDDESQENNDVGQLQDLIDERERLLSSKRSATADLRAREKNLVDVMRQMKVSHDSLDADKQKVMHLLDNLDGELNNQSSNECRERTAPSALNKSTKCTRTNNESLTKSSPLSLMDNKQKSDGTSIGNSKISPVFCNLSSEDDDNQNTLNFSTRVYLNQSNHEFSFFDDDEEPPIDPDLSPMSVASKSGTNLHGSAVKQLPIYLRTPTQIKQNSAQFKLPLPSSKKSPAVRQLSGSSGHASLLRVNVPPIRRSQDSGSSQSSISDWLPKSTQHLTPSSADGSSILSETSKLLKAETVKNTKLNSRNHAFIVANDKKKQQTNGSSSKRIKILH